MGHLVCHFLSSADLYFHIWRLEFTVGAERLIDWLIIMSTKPPNSARISVRLYRHMENLLSEALLGKNMLRNSIFTECDCVSTNA